MKRSFITFFGAAALSLAFNAAAQQSINNNATEPYEKTQVQAHLRLNLEKETDAVQFIRDNTDPYVVTKTYVLKNADPYELRPYLRNIVQARRVSQDNTTVECIKLMDGTGILIVSAELERFGKQENGMGIDEIINALDQPKVVSSSGSTYYLYYPMYRNAQELREMIWNSGIAHTNDAYELQKGVDKVVTDIGTNSLFFFITNSRKKTVDEMMAKYDTPILQANVKYTIYELDDENDGKMGMDFQSWKNNDGADILSVGGRYRSNWTSTWDGGVAPQTGSNKTQFFSLNPKWNSKYLDFLVSEGHAKVVTTGEILVRNNETGIIDRSTNIFVPEQTDMPDKVLSQYIAVSGTIYNSRATAEALVTTSTIYYFSAKDSVGRTVSLSTASISGSMSSVKMIPQGNNSATRYQLAVQGGTLIKDGQNVGYQTDDLSSFAIYKREADATGVFTSWTAVAWTDDIVVQKAYKLNTAVGPSFGFTMTVVPKICSESSTLSVKINNSSLVGWQSNGDPRITRNSEITADVMISNKGNRFVIGGIEKDTVVRSTSGVPYLRELPGLGWLFSSESETTKKSRLVVVGECVTSPIDQDVPQPIAAEQKVVHEKLKDAGIKNTWGFDQYYIDK